MNILKFKAVSSVVAIAMSVSLCSSTLPVNALPEENRSVISSKLYDIMSNTDDDSLEKIPDGRRWHLNFTPTGQSEQTYSIYADYNNKPFRVSIAWEGEVINDENKLTDYDLYIYKGDKLVASSTGTRNNEVIVIPAETVAQYSAGYYTAKIVRFGSANTTSDCVGLAWEQ